MTEEVLGIFPCLVQKQSMSVYLTTDRLIFHLIGGAVENSQVIMLNSVTGFIMNKPRPELPPEQQKSLIKLQYRDPDSGQSRDRVLDFVGDERFGNVVRCEELLRLHAGDKAEERRLRLKREAEHIARRRSDFLEANPEILKMYEYLTSPDGGGLTVDEFWEQYYHNDEDYVDSVNETTIPIPLRLEKEETIVSDTNSGVSDERKSEIFAQFPKVSELFAQLVPISISEKGFWKRFFHSQYFNLTQGSVGGADVIFDSLITPINLSDYHCTDTEIDLCQEFEKKSLDKLPLSYSTLVNRFNSSSALPGGSDRLQSTDDIISLLDKRRKVVEAEEETFEAVKAGIEKLRLMRTKIDTAKVIPDDTPSLVPRITPGMPGVAASTVAMTTELVSKNADKRKSHHVLSNEEERVIELGKFFFACKISEQDKRAKIVSTLNKFKSSSLNGIINNIELINSNLDR